MRTFVRWPSSCENGLAVRLVPAMLAVTPPDATAPRPLRLQPLALSIPVAMTRIAHEDLLGVFAPSFSLNAADSILLALRWNVKGRVFDLPPLPSVPNLPPYLRRLTTRTH